MSKRAIVTLVAVVVVGFVGFGIWYAAPITKDDVGDEVGEALQSTSDYFHNNFSFSEKDDFLSEAREKLDVLKAQSEELKKSVGDTSRDGGDKITAKIDELEVKLAEAKNASAEQWDEVILEFASAYSKAKDMFQSH